MLNQLRHFTTMKLISSAPLSDEEIVARARKTLATSRAFGVMLIIMSVLMCGATIWGAMFFIDMVIDEVERSGSQWPWFWIGLSTGASVAALFVAIAHLALYLIAATTLSFYQQRDRLLVRYHEELHAKRASLTSAQ